MQVIPKFISQVHQSFSKLIENKVKNGFRICF
uniref:Uncharacterized protein n=1 Tax=Rhizophora mucronata TaxID=61149 RepID=A0A2P2IZX4_RHIMU